MAEIKNFSLVGIGSSVQLGKGGAKIAQVGGNAISLYTQDGATLAPLHIATPTADTHAVTKLYVDQMGLDKKSKIVSEDGYTTVDSENGGAGHVTVTTRVGTEGSYASNLTATFKSSPDADSGFVFDGSAPGRLTFGSDSATAESVDLHFQPKGVDGSVYFGNTDQATMLQAEAGGNFTLSGGDGSAEITKGGNLILKGGLGFVDGENEPIDGGVLFVTASGRIMGEFTGDNNASSKFQFTTGTSGAILQVGGDEENIDLLLKAKGTGRVHFDGSRVGGIGQPLENDDIASKQYVDDTVGNINIEPDFSGSIRTLEGGLGYTGASIGMITGTVRRIIVKIITPYTHEITIGHGDLMTQTTIVGADSIDETVAGEYEITLNHTFSEMAELFVNVDGAVEGDAGSMEYVVEYVQG